jgi:hypothetical protein
MPAIVYTRSAAAISAIAAPWAEIWNKNRSRAAAVILFVSSFVVYTCHENTFETADTAPTRLIPILLLTQGNLRFDAYLPVFEAKYPHLKGDMYFLRQVSGHYISGFPVTPGVLLTPFYAPFVAYYHQGHPTPERWMEFADSAERIAAACIASLGALLLYYVLLELGASVGVATLLAAVYAFGTNAFVTFSQQLWQHGFTVLFILSALLVALPRRRKENRWMYVACGIATGLAVACRPTSIVFVGAFGLWMLIERPRGIVYFAVGIAAILTPIVAYNYSVYRNIFGGYSVYLSTAPHALGRGSVLAALLFSPGRGLFVYFPLGLLSCLGFYLALTRRNTQSFFYWLLVLFCVGQTALIWWLRWNNDWFGGHCWGPRYLSEIEFALVIALLPLVQAYSGMWVTAFVTVLAILSISMQAIGVYVRNDWNALPADINVFPARTWSVKDSPISRAIGHKLPFARTYISLPENPLRLNAGEPAREMDVDGTTVLFVHAPSEIALRTDTSAHSVSGRFGIVPGAYSEGGMTDGVEFFVDFVDQRGRRSTLFRRYLRPVTNPKDRGLQDFSVRIPDAPGEIDLLARSGPEDNRAWDWAYWGDVKLGY